MWIEVPQNRFQKKIVYGGQHKLSGSLRMKRFLNKCKTTDEIQKFKSRVVLAVLLWI
jgi:hypothetical protein